MSAMRPTLRLGNTAEIIVEVTDHMCPAFDGVIVHPAGVLGPDALDPIHLLGLEGDPLCPLRLPVRPSWRWC